jgi:hypothetical protein
MYGCEMVIVEKNKDELIGSTNIDYCSFEYKADKWETPRRMIVLRKDTNKTGKDTLGK